MLYGNNEKFCGSLNYQEFNIYLVSVRFYYENIVLINCSQSELAHYVFTERSGIECKSIKAFFLSKEHHLLNGRY